MNPETAGDDPTQRLTMDAVVGLSDMALDAGLVYVSGGAMIDERFYETVKWLVAQIPERSEDAGRGSLVDE